MLLLIDVLSSTSPNNKKLVYSQPNHSQSNTN